MHKKPCTYIIMTRPSALTIIGTILGIIIAARMLLYLFHGRQLTRLERYLIKENEEQDDDLRSHRTTPGDGHCKDCS